MAAPSQSAVRRPAWQLRWALLLIGGTGVVAQIVLLRELLALFQGNEFSIAVMLAMWLLWTGLGSGLLGRLTEGISRQRELVATLQAVSGLALPAAVAVIRYSRVLTPAITGEVLGPGRMMLTSGIALALFCPLSGLLFATASRWYVRETGAAVADGTSYAYMLESLGAAVFGMLANFVLLPYLNSFEITIALACANLILASWTAAPRRLATLLTALALLGGAWTFRSAGRWEAASLAAQWPGFRLVETRASKYGTLSVLEVEGARSLAESGTILFTSPDPEAAEEAVHFVLLQHPQPRSVLLIGGGVNGSAAQVLQYPSVERLDYVELDPLIFAVSQRHFPREWAPIRNDRRIHVRSTDGRALLRGTREKFDAIILNLPGPSTAQLNRFYTREFFADVRSALNPSGVFGFQFRAAENYLSPARAAVLQCILRTLREEFSDVQIAPGDTVHFLASTQAGLLTTDARVLARRIAERRLRTEYVREYFLSFRLAPERVADLAGQVNPAPDTPVNRDFIPAAYYLQVAAWSTQFDPRYAVPFRILSKVRFAILIAVLAIGTLLLLLVMRFTTPARRMAAAAAVSITAMGMTMLALEVFLLLGFQAIFGYVYHQLAVIIAGFMLGMAAGTWLGIRWSFRTERAQPYRIILVQCAAAALSVLLAVTLAGVPDALRGLAVIANLGFPMLAAVCGTVGGLQFPIASRLFFFSRGERSAGAMYGFDLLGSCVGALAVSLFVLPVFGLYRTAALLAAVNCAAAIGFVVVRRR